MAKKNYLKATIAVLSFVLFTSNAFAFRPFRSQRLEQARGPVFNLTAQAQDAPTSAPFDGGISLLIAAGLGYASKKGYDKRKQIKEAQRAEN